MHALGDVLRSVDQEIQLGWHSIRDWADRAFTGKGKAEIILLSFTLALCAVMLLFMHGALQNSTMVSVSPYLSAWNFQLGVPGH